MARTQDQIKQSMIDAKNADSNLSSVDSTSLTALWRLMVNIVAYCAWSLEVLFDNLVAEINYLVDLLKPHTLRWYASKCKDFQYGFSLQVDSDRYDNTGFTADQIAASKIIQYAAVVEQEKSLRIKVATIVNGDLAQVPSDKLSAFKEFMNRIKDAGVKLQIDSLPPDKVKAHFKIYFDPLILNINGQRLDGTSNEPIQTAFNNFLKSLPFNGTFVTAYLIDALQKVEGVVIPQLISCSASYGEIVTPSVDVMYVPDAGFMRLENDSDLTLEFIAQSVIQ